MKIKHILFIVSVILITSCSENKQAKLQNLKLKRDKLNVEIAELSKEVSKNTNDNNIKYVNIKKTKKIEFKHFVEVQGNVESDNNILIPAQAGGVVEKVFVDEGDKVIIGQLLAQVDGKIIQSSIDELTTNLNLATTVFKRQQRLWAQKIGSEIQFLQAKNSKESLEKKLITLNEQYKKTFVYSSIDGNIDAVMVKEGEAVKMNAPAFRLIQLSKLKIKASLSERYINNVKKGDIVDVSLPSINKSFTYKIEAVSQLIDPYNRTFSIEINIPKSLKGVKPNMMAVLKINDYTNKEAFVVPVNIIQKVDGKSFVFIAKNNNGKWYAKKQMIKTDVYYKNNIEVTQGLKENENVIIFGFQELSDNQKININN